MANKDKIDLQTAMCEFIKFDKMHRSLVEKYVTSMGIHRSQHRMLMFLSKTKGTVNQKDIAERFNVSPASVSVSIRKMEEAGYIKRKSNTEDSRNYDIVITEKGREIVEKSKKAFNQIDTCVFSEFTDDEITQLMEYIKRMQASLQNAEIELTKNN